TSLARFILYCGAFHVPASVFPKSAPHDGFAAAAGAVCAERRPSAPPTLQRPHSNTVTTPRALTMPNPSLSVPLIFQIVDFRFKIFGLRALRGRLNPKPAAWSLSLEPF